MCHSNWSSSSIVNTGNFLEYELVHAVTEMCLSVYLILYICVLPAFYLSLSSLSSTLWYFTPLKQPTALKLIKSGAFCDSFLHVYATNVLKCLIVNHCDFLQDVLSLCLSVVLKVKTQIQDSFSMYAFAAVEVALRIQFAFFSPKFYVHFLLMTSDEWNL